jgi:CO/xanthine dehydrogenase FAD-binding subunit
MVNEDAIRGYHPISLSDALDFLDSYDATVFAGGTDLMVKHRRFSGLTPSLNKPVLFISHLKAMHGIQVNDGILTIRAATTLTDLLSAPQVPTFIKAVLSELASVSIRNLGTIGGNICNASPAGDTIPMLVALDAELELTSLMDKRTLPICDFILGPGKTALGHGELLTAIHIPILPTFEPENAYNHFFYRKIGNRKSNAISKISFFGIAHKDPLKFNEIRMAFGAAAPTVIRDKTCEKQIIGLEHDIIESRIDIFLQQIESKLNPIDDIRSTKDYRLDVLLNLTRSFILDEH